MEKSSYQKLREKLDRIDFIAKYTIKKFTDELKGIYNEDQYTEGMIAAMKIIQYELEKDEKSND